MLHSAVSVLVVAHSSSEIPEGFMNNPVYMNVYALGLSRSAYIPQNFEIINHMLICFRMLKGKVKVHPTTGYEGPDGE